MECRITESIIVQRDNVIQIAKNNIAAAPEYKHIQTKPSVLHKYQYCFPVFSMNMNFSYYKLWAQTMDN
jgi:hypothetical protein